MTKSTTIAVSLLYSMLLFHHAQALPADKGVEVATAAVQSPHAQALALVFQTQGDKIAQMDIKALSSKKFVINEKDWWWHDTCERQWSVRRPFGPGYINSTQMFQVSYSINGKTVGKWFVDTKTKRINSLDEKSAK
ncbi:MAG: hypothetical protein K2Z81_13770 [Cyanobacteria bacterium]|nr:hypothetical protein [Cyanobacteriota bacterium]